MNLPSKHTLLRVNLPDLEIESDWYRQYPGKEHYRLLHHLCENLDLVFDVGTYQGYSAAAMSSAKKVISYDVEDLKVKQDYPSNIDFRIGSVLDDKELSKANLVLLDTYHEGSFERVFVKFLEDIKFKGILVVDDINYNDAMRKFWNYIELPKIDATHLGHHSGTGIVLYE